MTNEQINAAIAEVCGFVGLEEFQPNKNGPKFRFWDYPENWTGPNIRPWCPDFCNDLNAMHEAEAVLSIADTHVYINLLYDIACKNQEQTGKWLPYSIRARQRAEAFLRTLGKWKE